MQIQSCPQIIPCVGHSCCVLRYVHNSDWFPPVCTCFWKTTAKLMVTVVKSKEISTKLAEEAHRGWGKVGEEWKGELFLITQQTVQAFGERLCLKMFFSHLVPAFQGPFPLLQHETLVFIRPLDVALTDFQPFNDFPAVSLLERDRNTALCQN